MARYELVAPTRVIFGLGASAELPPLASSLGHHALVVTGKHPDRQGAAIAQLVAAGVATSSFSVGHEPTADDVTRGTRVAREAGCDLVVSIGGGSALDTGKVVSALLTNAGDVIDYLEVIGGGRQLEDPSAPHIAVPTTSGTGSEVTKNAVVLSEAHRIKVSMRSPFMVPTVALVDPELTRSMPRSVTVNSGLDALTHLLESYVSLRANPLIDPLCEDGIKRAARSLHRAASDGDDMEARSEMSLASLYGGLALANAGLGAVHGFAGVLGGRLHVPHGLACGSLLTAVFDANITVAASTGAAVVPRFEHVARLLTGNPAATAPDAVAWLSNLVDTLELSPLRDFGLTAQMSAGICEDAAGASSMKGNPVPLTGSQLQEILSAAT